MSAFDSVLPPLDGIDNYRVINLENSHHAFFSRLRDAVTCAKMFRGTGALVCDERNGRILFTVGSVTR